MLNLLQDPAVPGSVPLFEATPAGTLENVHVKLTLRPAFQKTGNAKFYEISIFKGSKNKCFGAGGKALVLFIFVSTYGRDVGEKKVL